MQQEFYQTGTKFREAILNVSLYSSLKSRLFQGQCLRMVRQYLSLITHRRLFKRSDCFFDTRHLLGLPLTPVLNILLLPLSLLSWESDYVFRCLLTKRAYDSHFFNLSVVYFIEVSLSSREVVVLCHLKQYSSWFFKVIAVSCLAFVQGAFRKIASSDTGTSSSAMFCCTVLYSGVRCVRKVIHSSYCTLQLRKTLFALETKSKSLSTLKMNDAWSKIIL